MDQLHTVLPYILWIGLVSGGVLVVLLLLSIISGADTEMDADVDGDVGGLGLVKSILVFVAFSALTIYAVALNSDLSWAWILLSGAAAGIVSIWILTMIIQFLLSRQEEGNWYVHEAEAMVGTVYIPIPSEGVGRIVVEVGGAEREIDAQSMDGIPIETGRKVLVITSDSDKVIVSPFEQEE